MFSRCWISSISLCAFLFLSLQHFYKLDHIFSCFFFLRVRFISLLHSVGMQPSRSRPRPRLVTETAHMSAHTHAYSTHSHTLNQTDTNTCFGFCINALSCTSSSAAFIVVMLLHHSDCT